MTPKNIHIGIEQILQAIDSNIYLKFKPKELDLQFNTICDWYASYVFSNRVNQGNEKLFEHIQRDIDNIRLLLVTNVLLPIANNITTLPDNYRDLINTRSLVNRLNCTPPILSGNIQGDTYYKNNLNSTIVYSGNPYITGKVFQGIEGISIFSINQVPNTGSVIALEEVPNRIIEGEYKTSYKRNPIVKSKWYSPITELYQNSIKVTIDSTFKVEGIVVDYMRILVPLDSTLTTDWNTEFSNEVIRTLIDLTAKRLLFIVRGDNYQISGNELAK